MQIKTYISPIMLIRNSWKMIVFWTYSEQVKVQQSKQIIVDETVMQSFRGKPLIPRAELSPLPERNQSRFVRQKRVKCAEECLV